MEQEVLEPKVTANQLYKQYKNEGGTLEFAAWINREKAKGTFLLNGNLNAEVTAILKDIKTEDNAMDKTFLGFPVKTLAITGAVIVGAIIIAKLVKRK